MDIFLRLSTLSSLDYKKFSEKLVNQTSYPIIGVQVPKLRSLAKNILSIKDKEFVINYVLEKHTYFEECFLSAFLISFIKLDFDEKIKLIEKFLPFIDNWAITDSFCASLKDVGAQKEKLLPFIKKWLKSNHSYTVRTALVLLIDYYTIPEHTQTILEITKNLKADDYYINMAISWLYSILLVKDYQGIISLLQAKTLPKFIQNKTIQKAVESFRISSSKKEYLKTLKI